MTKEERHFRYYLAAILLVVAGWLFAMCEISDKPWTPFKSTPYVPDTVNKNLTPTNHAHH